MSKKFLSLALALVMCLGLTVPAFAAEEKLKVTITFDGYLRTEYVKGDGENEFMAVRVVKDGSNVKLECPGAEGLAVEDEYERELEVTCLQYTKGAGWAPGSAEPFLDGLSQDSGVIIDASTKTFTATSADADSSIFVIGFRPRFDTFYDDSRFDVEEIYWMSESGYAQLAPEHKGVPGAGSEIVGTVGPDKPTQPTGGPQVSDWAKEQVNRAAEIGLVPDSLGNDYRVSITRAQFAATAVKLYEAMSGQKAPAAGESPFSDTSDPAVIQAQALGIVSGVGDGKFAADALVTREQAAAMLSRVYTNLGGNIPEVAGTTFDDNGEVSDWARDAVAFMADKGIVSGVGNNSFAPLGNASIEQALVIALRMFDNLK